MNIPKLWRRKRPVRKQAPPPQFTIPDGYKLVERYPLKEPFAYANIAYENKAGTYGYFLEESPMTPQEKRYYQRIVEFLEYEIKTNPGIDIQSFFEKEAERVVNKYKIASEELTESSWNRIIYYVIRDIVGFGPVDPLARDQNVEDITCDGVNKPIYLWHRNYENIETDLTLKREEELDDLIIKLVHKAGKHISTAFPIVDATLPGKHRLAACFRREITPFGSAFTIRKFREDPFTITDFLRMHTLDPALAAYLWLCMENRFSVMVIGGTGSGKTTALNVLACLIRPGSKVITIEETAELNLPQQNWMSFITKSSYGLGAEKIGEVDLFDLVKASLRHRPDVLIVGEVRGQEAYVLFQALATGHGGMCTMHAETLTAAIKRLTSPPMNVAPSYIPMMNLALVVRRVRTGESGRATRRIVSCQEIIDSDEFYQTFEWDPSTDKYTHNLGDSMLLRSIARQTGKTFDQTIEEIERRERVLTWMSHENHRTISQVSDIVSRYCGKPEEVYEHIGYKRNTKD